MTPQPSNSDLFYALNVLDDTARRLLAAQPGLPSAMALVRVGDWLRALPGENLAD